MATTYTDESGIVRYSGGKREGRKVEQAKFNRAQRGQRVGKGNVFQGGGNYTVGANDNPFTLAQQLFGNQSYAAEIIALNGANWRPGQVIKLPTIRSGQERNQGALNYIFGKINAGGEGAEGPQINENLPQVSTPADASAARYTGLAQESASVQGLVAGQSPITYPNFVQASNQNATFAPGLADISQASNQGAFPLPANFVQASNQGATGPSANIPQYITGGAGASQASSPAAKPPGSTQTPGIKGSNVNMTPSEARAAQGTPLSIDEFNQHVLDGQIKLAGFGGEVTPEMMGYLEEAGLLDGFQSGQSTWTNPYIPAWKKVARRRGRRGGRGGGGSIGPTRSGSPFYGDQVARLLDWRIGLE